MLYNRTAIAFGSIAAQAAAVVGRPTCWARAFRSNRFLNRKQEFVLADIGEGIAEVEVLKWFVKPGDQIEQFQKLCEVQSDKATVEITSRFDGTVQSLNVDVGGMAKVGESLVTLDVADQAATSDIPAMPSESPLPPPPSKPTRQQPERHEKFLATPAVRRLCREHNLDPLKIRPTGPDGRVLKADVLAVIEDAAAPGTPPATTLSETVLPISGLARIMVKTMTAANAVPTLTLHEEIVADELRRVRAALKPSLPTLTYLPLVLKAISLALSDFPQLNAHVDDACTTLTLKRDHNISIAMDTPRGLIVPCVKRVQERSIGEIAAELARLSKLGVQNRLGTDDLQGGTFAISNIGTIGGTYATPLLVRPQVVIGAIGRIQTGIARFNEDDAIVKTSIMAISWSADHRVIDGATIARFSRRVKDLLEAPHMMLLITK